MQNELKLYSLAIKLIKEVDQRDTKRLNRFKRLELQTKELFSKAEDLLQFNKSQNG